MNMANPDRERKRILLVEDNEDDRGLVVFKLREQGYLVKPVNLDDLERTVARLTSREGGRDFEAWKAEIAALREETAIQYKEQVERMESAKDKRLRAKEKLMRFKAEKAFLEAGSTRGEFTRRWPSVFVEEARSHRAGE